MKKTDAKKGKDAGAKRRHNSSSDSSRPRAASPSRPSRPFPPSPTRPLGSHAPGPGTWVVVYLREPREKAFGMLLHMETAGGWFRGIELGSFEDWAREIASGREATMGLSTFFVPFLRVEKMVADEPTGAVPSLGERFEAITGWKLDAVLEESAP